MDECSSTQRTFDDDGKITQIDSAGLKTYSYDDAFRITGITDTTDPSLSWTYGYDDLDRLTSAVKTGMTLGYSYDANGNRLTQTGSGASAFTIASNSNRLTSISGALTRTYGYDNAGNTTSFDGITFTYNNRGRMKSSTKNGVTTNYTYNALGQLIKKGASALYYYDDAGHVLGSYDGSGALTEEIVWLGDIPLATLRPTSGAGVDIYYIQSDHLNTPRLITDASSNSVRWKWDADPFGGGAPVEIGAFAFDLRFQGQMYFAETGLSYNYYRDAYDPALGRYTQSDPIGISGGLNTYAYAGANPIDTIDPAGLQGSPGIGDQINPFGVRGDGVRDYTSYFERRFPNTMSGAQSLLTKRLIEKVCANKPSTSVAGLNGGQEDIDINPNMQRFGDRAQNWYERNVQIGKFEIRTDTINVVWVDLNCSLCFDYNTTMYVQENTGDNRLGANFRERSVRMGEWPMKGRGCCGY